MNSKKRQKIVVIGGGTGAFTVLSGLRKFPVDLAVVVSMADDGGSTGILREEFGVLPPGDVRRALVALAHSDNRLLSRLFNYRFEEGGLKGHNFGNIMLAALERVTGNFKDAVAEAGRILGIQGEVLPVTFDNVRLFAKLEDGTTIQGETNIDIPKHDGGLAITKIWLEPAAGANKDAIRAIRGADLVVIGPGDLYTSVLPNFLVKGISEAVCKSKGKKIYIANIMTKWGETHGFTAAHFVVSLEHYLGGKYIDYVLINTTRPSPERLRRYEKESAEFVTKGALTKNPKHIFGNFLRPRGFIRHDPETLAKTLVKLLE